MEFEDLEELIEHESARVAAAFGVNEWKANEERHKMGVRCTSQHLMWVVDSSRAKWWGIRAIGPNGKFSSIYDATQPSFQVPSGSHWVCDFDVLSYEVMARGLYRLGFEDKEVLDQLPPLSAHEKLELRLSLPRDFWPKEWLEEENAI